jgi:dienelactone hydrolase
LEKAGTKATVEIFKGTQHGFQFSERAVYSPEASEQVWDKIFKLWDRTLK